MKSTSKKTSGLLGGFDFQPVFSEQTLSRSEPKEEEVSQTKPNNAEQEQVKPVKPQTAMHGRVKQN